MSARVRLRGIGFDDLGDLGARAVAHQQDAVGEQDGFVHVVGDHEHGLVRGLDDLQQLVLDGAAGQRVERAEGFVEQQHLGLDGEGAGDADALLHAAGEFGRLLVDGVAEADHFEILVPCARDLFALSSPGGGCARRIRRSSDAHPGHQRVALEHHAAVEAGPHFAAVHDGVAGAGFIQPGQAFRMVVLPQPEWPMMQTNSPRSM
jgi:hypothetical protein